MIDFQNDGLEYQVYALIAKMCELGCSDEFPKFITNKLDNGKWECTLSIPGVKKEAIGIGSSEVDAINKCALKMRFILSTEYDKDQYDPDIDDSLFQGNIEQFFGDVDYNHAYRYHLCETDIRIREYDEYAKKLLKSYLRNTIEHIKRNGEEITDMSDIVTVRLLVRKKKQNCC